MAWLSVVLRRLRDERATVVGLAVLVIATALVFAVAPRALEQVADEALRAEIGAAPAVERNIQLLEERRVVADPRGPMAGVAVLGERLETSIPPAVAALIVDRSHFADTPRFLTELPTLSTAILRFGSGVADRVELVDGRLPTGAARTTPAWWVADGASAAPDVLVLEAMVSATSAAAIGIGAGETLHLEVDQTDRLAGGGHDDRLAIDVVGIYEVSDPGDDWWLDDPSYFEPRDRQVTPDIVYLDVTFILAAEAYDPYIHATEAGELPLRYTWRYHLDPRRLTSGTADAVVSDLRRMEGTFTTAATGGQGAALRSGLLRLAAEQRLRWTSAEAVLMVAAVGPAAVALAAIALVASLAARRRRPALVLWRGRGASTTQVAAGALAEAALIAVPAALLGLVVAVTIVPGPALGPSAVLALGVAVVAILAVLATILIPGATDAPAARGVDAGGVRRRASPRRLALEGLVVILAIVGVVLLRERGIRGTSSTGELAGADPFIAAVPVLVGLAAALVAMRLFPLATRFGAAIAAARRDLVPVLALRRSARGTGQGAILLVLLATAAIGSFALTTLIHLDRSADVNAWQTIGAQVRVDRDSGESLRRSLGEVDLPDVSAEALGWLGEATFGARGATVELLAVALDDLGAVVVGTPADTGLSAILRTDSSAADAAVPAVVSRAMAEGRDAVGPGDSFRLYVFGPEVEFTVVEVRDAVPGIDPDGLWVVAGLAELEAGRGQPLDPTTRFVRAPDGATPAIREAAEAAGGAGARVRSQVELAASLHGSPAVEAVTAGITLSVVVAAIYAGLALLVAMALAGADRGNEVALLRTLGLSDRQTGALAVAEQGPTVAAAFAMGALLGLGLFLILRPGLGLSVVVGSTLDVPLDLDAAAIGLFIVLVAAGAVAAILLGALAGRAASPIAVARRGLDT